MFGAYACARGRRREHEEKITRTKHGEKPHAIYGGCLQIGITEEVYRIYEGSEYRQVENSTAVLPTGGF